MIFANIKEINRYKFLESNILDCIKYALENNLEQLDNGTYYIDGENIFINIVEYETKTREERFWESHRKYIDIHLMLNGKEIIAINSIDNLDQNEYKENEDFLELKGKESSFVTLTKGDFLICYPEDAHMTAIQVNGKEVIKKAIFKVKIK